MYLVGSNTPLGASAATPETSSPLLPRTRGGPVHSLNDRESPRFPAVWLLQRD